MSETFRSSAMTIKGTLASQRSITCVLSSQDMLLLLCMWLFAKEARLTGQQASRYLPVSASHLIIAGMISTCHIWPFNGTSKS